MRNTMIPVALLTLALAACGAPDASDESAAEATPATAEAVEEATAALQTAEGQPAGTATVSQGPGSVRIVLSVEGLPPGEHGVHVHMTGACDAPTFESAGAHWNPAGQAHGLEDPPGQHAGDMPNLTVAEDGSGALEYHLIGGSFADLMDADGAAFVIHADPDDQMTDPSGNSGDRIACGVFSGG